jgi:hypothetical protein
VRDRKEPKIRKTVDLLQKIIEKDIKLAPGDEEKKPEV